VSNVLNNFDIASDLKVEFFLPDAEGNLFIIGISLLGGDDVLAGANQFVIGVSLLGGTDVLAGDSPIAFTWQAFECSTSAVQTSVGGEVQDALYFQPQSAQATITVQNLLIDPTQNPAFRPGVPVRVRLERDLVDVTLFNGFIDVIQVNYDSVSNTNLMKLTAYDNFKRFVNSRLALLDTADEELFPDGYATPYEVIEILADQFGTDMHSTSAETRGKIPGELLTDFIPNTPLYEAIQVGLGLFWLDPATQEFVFIPRVAPDVSESTYSIGNNHNEPLHLCMSDLSVASDIDAVFNSLKVSLKSDSATSVIVRNTDSIQLYGEFALDTEINTTDTTELTSWANAVFNATQKQLVKSVETPAIDRLGNLTHAAVFLPGETVAVNYQTPQLNINQGYTITKVSHNINVNQWFTTLELWKEF
jgi:hypothetical protein